MWSLRDTPRGLKDSTALVVCVTAGMGFLLGAFARPSWQVAVESAQVLSGIVDYPVHNSFHIYHVKLWTVMNQFLAIPLLLGVSERTLSMVVSGGIAGLSYAAVGLCALAFSRNAFWAMAAPFLIDFTGVKEVLAVNYPMDFMGTPHTYGVAGLAWVLLTLSLLGLGCYRSGGVCLGLAPAVHPSMGAWCWLTLSAALVWNGFESIAFVRRVWKPVAVGAVLSAGSLLLQISFMRPVVPDVDDSTKSQFISSWVEFFDFHRRPVSVEWTGVQLGLAAVAIGLYWIPFWDRREREQSWLLTRTMIVVSAAALCGAAVTHMPASIVPPEILTLMPTRLFLLSNLIFVCAVWGVLGRSSSVWLRAAGLLLAVVLIAGDGSAMLYGIAAAAIASAVWKSLEPWMAASRPVRAEGAVTALAALLLLGLALQGLYVRMQAGAAARGGMVDRTNNAVLRKASETPGIVLTGTECCAFAQLRTHRPILVEVRGMDQIMYAPESGPDMNAALESVYGVDLLHPQESLRSDAFAEDLTPVTKPLWESRSAAEWERLGAEFGFTAVLTNPGWKLQLPEAARDGEHVLYSVSP